MTTYNSKRAPNKRSLIKYIKSLPKKPKFLHFIHPKIYNHGPMIYDIPISTMQRESTKDLINIKNNKALILSDEEARFKTRSKSYHAALIKQKFSVTHQHDPKQRYKIFIWNGHGSDTMLSPHQKKISLTHFPHADLAICICCSSQLMLGHQLVKKGIVKTYIGSTCRVSTKEHNQLASYIQKHYKKNLPIFKLINNIHQEIKNDQNLLTLWRNIQIVGSLN